MSNDTGKPPGPEPLDFQVEPARTLVAECDEISIYKLATGHFIFQVPDGAGTRGLTLEQLWDLHMAVAATLRREAGLP